MSDVDTGINDVDVNAIIAGRIMLIESECSETECATVGDTGKTLGDSGITNHVARAKLRNILMEQSTEYHGHEQWSLV